MGNHYGKWDRGGGGLTPKQAIKEDLGGWVPL